MARIYTRPSVDGPLGHACRVNKIVPGLAKACRVAEATRRPDRSRRSEVGQEVLLAGESSTARPPFGGF